MTKIARFCRAWSFATFVKNHAPAWDRFYRPIVQETGWQKHR